MADWTDWAGRKHDRFIGRPVSMHAMRGISAHSNGFDTCRAIHLLQMLLGSIDCPGGFRYKPPFPRLIPMPQLPTDATGPLQPLKGPPLGFPLGPEHLLVDDARQAEADRQGLLLGRAALGPWPHAYGDPQRLGAAIPIRSTRCSSTWRTWPGTRR